MGYMGKEGVGVCGIKAGRESQSIGMKTGGNPLLISRIRNAVCGTGISLKPQVLGHKDRNLFCAKVDNNV